MAEILLGGAFALYLAALGRGRATVSLPRIFRVWLVWAALQIIACVRSGSLAKGGGELRHLGLIAALFLLLPTLDRTLDRLAVWRGIFVVGSVSSLVLVAHFVFRLLWHERGLDPAVYLRDGGLLHHWMVFATVEVVIFAGLLEFWRGYPEARRMAGAGADTARGGDPIQSDADLVALLPITPGDRSGLAAFALGLGASSAAVPAIPYRAECGPDTHRRVEPAWLLFECGEAADVARGLADDPPAST